MSAYDKISDDYLAYVDQSLADSKSPLSLATNTLLSVAGSVNKLEVVDIGCGEGHLVRKLAPYAKRVTGVDYSKNLLDAARERTNASNVEYIHDDVQGLTRLPRNSADLVLCNMALMDMKNLPAVYASVARTLRSGGRFVFSVTHPCFQSPESRIEIGADGAFASRRIVRYAAEERWQSEDNEDIGGKVGVYHRPLQSYINMLMANSLTLSQIVEPVLPEPGDGPASVAMLVIPAVLVVAASK